MSQALSTPRLSPEQIESFHADGLVVLRGAFDAAEVQLIEAWTQDIATRPEEIGKHWVFHEQSKLDPARRLINRIENISPFHPGFETLSKVLAGPVAQLLGEDAVLFKEKINFKMPGGDGFKPHQDSQAGWEAYARYFISVMVCIDEATLENGCLRMVAGQQRRGLFREWEPLTDEDMQGMDFAPCPTQPGDVVFFDCYAPHSSEPNFSQKIRRLYFATYNRMSEGDHLERYYADKRKSFPPDIEREAGKEYVFRV
jgi:ectoine hydroxylase-related dioxygenase (phytanoyl-CoA dioxygenase family)